MKYTVLRRETRLDIKKAVQELIDRGWVPQGGICCVVVPEDTWLDEFCRCPSKRLWFCQAMTLD